MRRFDRCPALSSSAFRSRSFGAGAEIPFLLTPDTHGGTTARDLDVSAQALAAYDIRATYLVLAHSLTDSSFARALLRLLEAGHDIGCHGFDHSEDFAHDSSTTQQATLRRARETIEGAVSKPVRVFRAPAFRIGRATVRALQREQFIVDMSVNPQRLCLFSSHAANIGWLRAPRAPYRMDVGNPNRRGTSRVIEIPTSSFGVPLASTLYQAFGVRYALRFTAALAREAVVAGRPRPLVFAGHPEDFRGIPAPRPSSRAPLRWDEFVPRPKHGITVRYRLYETDRDVIADMTRAYFDGVSRSGRYEFETVSSYMRGKRNGSSV
jgi:hypothetical protein